MTQTNAGGAAAAGEATFRRATAADQDVIIGLVEEALSPYGLHADPGGVDHEVTDIARYFPPGVARAGAQLWVVEEAGEIVGCGAFTRFDPETCELKKMYLRPRCKGRGLGRRLLEWMEREARAAGYRRAWLETNTVLVEAVRMYEKFGYRPTEDGHICHRCNLKMAKML